MNVTRPSFVGAFVAESVVNVPVAKRPTPEAIVKNKNCLSDTQDRCYSCASYCSIIGGWCEKKEKAEEKKSKMVKPCNRSPILSRLDQMNIVAKY